ncbi:alpha-1A adrenergic receptor-like isoform X2 [Zootermopsis nevadensis]|nr:alpha-1A adrenergic receptor-like isoform X2 [Zootermopsis nevadensis]XP_021942611.1 alpha-1A adrenergic receptor-like isoform X2 [Zootermopsis nevadensis]XP_021942612.1 alpha-1A adrenergic receptor-like isoform X2 [Zootermopsis nevadensis]
MSGNASAPNGDDTDLQEQVSPVTLSADWSRVARLLLIASLAVIGSVGNIFMISSVMIEDHLKKRGNAFIVNVALADLLITGLVFPASTVVLLAGLKDTPGVCNFQWFLAILCCLVTLMTLAATAAENYARLCLSQDCYAMLTSTRITVAVLSIWLLSGLTVTLQFVYNVGPGYCIRRRLTGDVLPYYVIVGAFFVFLPASLTFACYLRITLRIRVAKSRPSFKPPMSFSWDYALMKTNLYSFMLFVVFWLPFGITLSVGSVHTIPSRLFYNLAWFALSKSCINNFLYCLTNRHFRNAYVNLFHYCCCKTTVSFSRRPRGASEVSGPATRPTGDVRVHIIPGYNMYSYTSPQRAREVCKTATLKRSVGSCRPSTSRPNGRDVYEL